MFAITKTFDFEYAHRVYTQNINEAFACEKPENTCRHIHGHSGKLTVTLASERVDNRGFVLDYKELGFIKKIVKDELDHKFIIGADDPMNHIFENIGYSSSREALELAESFTVVPIIPTSENLAEYYYNRIEDELRKITDTDYLVAVSWSETPTSTATFTKAR